MVDENVNNVQQFILRNGVNMDRPPSGCGHQRIIATYARELSSQQRAKFLSAVQPVSGALPMSRPISAMRPSSARNGSRRCYSAPQGRSGSSFHLAPRQATLNDITRAPSVCSTTKTVTSNLKGNTLCSSQKTPSSSKPCSGHRRVQSATTRLTGDFGAAGMVSGKLLSPTIRTSSAKTCTRPTSAKVIRPSSASKISQPRPLSASTQPSLEKVKRPSSAKCLPDCDKECDRELFDDLQPCVYGYQSKKVICGSENTETTSQTQWKTSEPPMESAVKEVLDPVFYDIDAPKSIRPLLPWLNTNIPSELTGIPCSDCLVFLPSLSGEPLENLPVVPVPHDPQEELPHYCTIEEPVVWAPKKYDHPWTKIPLPDYTCKHNHKHQPQVRIWAQDGNVLHESHTGVRTVDVVRKEIQELEDLMKGLGSKNGISIVVQYQAEINSLQNMIQATLGRVEEIERRDRAHVKASQPSDLCGLRKFYERHDDVMEQIRKQHEKCIQELAVLERDLNIPEKHFNALRPVEL